MTFDSAAARATQEDTSRRNFNQYQQNQTARSAGPASSPTRSTAVPPPIPNSSPATGNGGYTSYNAPRRTTVWYPDPQIYATRSVRIRNYYSPYWSRPVVVYNDNYNSFFWWWLLDQSIDSQALWVYNHRADIDDARYRALVYQNLELENRVVQLQQQQTPVDPNYVPAGMDRDLMYTDNYVNQAYATRPTTGGRIGFFVLAVPVVLATGCFLVWFVFFKRWQTATA